MFVEMGRNGRCGQAAHGDCRSDSLMYKDENVEEGARRCERYEIESIVSGRPTLGQRTCR